MSGKGKLLELLDVAVRHCALIRELCPEVWQEAFRSMSAQHVCFAREKQR